MQQMCIFTYLPEIGSVRLNRLLKSKRKVFISNRFVFTLTPIKRLFNNCFKRDFKHNLQLLAFKFEKEIDLTHPLYYLSNNNNFHLIAIIQ